MDSTGKIYVANFRETVVADSVTVYSAGSYAVGAPIATISGDNTGLSYPHGVGVDANGNISVLDDNGTVTTYAAGSSGNATPIATLSINSGKDTEATGIAVGRSGKIYVSVTGVVICRRAILPSDESWQGTRLPTRQRRKCKTGCPHQRSRHRPRIAFGSSPWIKTVTSM